MKAHVHRHWAGGAGHLDGVAVPARVAPRLHRPSPHGPGAAARLPPCRRCRFHHRDPQPLLARMCATTRAMRTGLRSARGVGSPVPQVIRCARSRVEGGMYARAPMVGLGGGRTGLAPAGTDTMTDMPGRPPHAALIAAIAAAPRSRGLRRAVRPLRATAEVLPATAWRRCRGGRGIGAGGAADGLAQGRPVRPRPRYRRRLDLHHRAQPAHRRAAPRPPCDAGRGPDRRPGPLAPGRSRCSPPTSAPAACTTPSIRCRWSNPRRCDWPISTNVRTAKSKPRSAFRSAP